VVRIGITRCHRIADYIEAVAASGAEPVVLDVDHGAEGLLKDLDGLVLSGGGDVDPALFGEAPHPAYSPAEEGRDTAEIALVRTALESKTPVLAICRGVQVLNVAAGGTLVQDIPTQVRHSLAHRIDKPKDFPAHEVAVSPGSKLAALLGADASRPHVLVNSRHHQAVNAVAPGFHVTAKATDGVIEALESDDPGAFCVGVQWHPENFGDASKFRELFRGLVRAAMHRHRQA
jgi:putative glutamine amidotransferase